MLSHDPTPLSFGPDEAHSIVHRVTSMLGHYDLRIYVTPTAYIDVGRGSFDAVLRLHAVAGDFIGCIGTVGQMCNFADCQLLGGGEHWNEFPVNVVMENIIVFGMPSRNIPSLRPKPKAPFVIGNAVVVSTHAKILQGAVVGDGAVLGANAVASGPLEPFGIYGGVPARQVRQRVDAEVRAAIEAVRWWDFDLIYLENNLAALQALAVDRHAAHVYRKPQPRLVIRLFRKANNFTFEIVGFVVDGAQRPIAEAPPQVHRYLENMCGPGPYYWLADMWNEAGA